jgi:hypothetical protein
MDQPKEVMTVAWGPFARQCASTRTSHYVMTGRSGPKEIATDHESCIGFAAMPAADGAMEITASTAANGQTSVSTLYRILRGPSGVSRPAISGDNGLLAQGNDSPKSAEAFAHQIGLSQQQIIDPKGTLLLPIILYVPSPVEGTLQCQPDGGGVDRGRETLVFSCVLDEQVHTDRVDATVRLAGMEEVDVLTGVRLSGSFAGSLIGYERFGAQMSGRQVDDHVWYERIMQFE